MSAFRVTSGGRREIEQTENIKLHIKHKITVEKIFGKNKFQPSVKKLWRLHLHKLKHSRVCMLLTKKLRKIGRKVVKKCIYIDGF